MLQGHNAPCHYCGEKCNSLHGSPSMWPVPLTHRDNPGVVKWHHIGCVTERLIENNQSLIEDARLGQQCEAIIATQGIFTGEPPYVGNDGVIKALKEICALAKTAPVYLDKQDAEGE